MQFKLRPIGIGGKLIGENIDNSLILIANKSKKKYTLQDLVNQPLPQDLTEEDQEWLNIKDFGEEKVWVTKIIEKCPKDIVIEAIARVQALVDYE